MPQRKMACWRLWLKPWEPNAFTSIPRRGRWSPSLRGELVELFAALGAASNQIGKTYRYLPSLKPETRALVESLKRVVDPSGLMNPGALGL